MAKSVRHYSETSGRNPEVRKRSRQAQNERRKIERRMARLISQETGTKVSAKEAIDLYKRDFSSNSQLTSLYEARESLVYKGRKEGYSGDVEKIRESVEAFTEIRFGFTSLSRKEKSDRYRRNKMFERNMNQATAKNGMSALSRDEVKAFYAGTRDIWGGSSVSDNRNAIVMQKLGVQDLETAYKLVTDSELDYREFGFADEETFNTWLDNLDKETGLLKRREIIKDELDNIRKAKMLGGSTDDMQYNGADEKTPETSPEYINRIASRIATALNYG